VNVTGPYATPSVPADSDSGPTNLNGDDAESIIKGMLTLKLVLPESVTMNCGLKIPAAVGVPPNAPDDELMLIPGGRPVADQV
jgi:hypothetical protein